MSAVITLSRTARAEQRGAYQVGPLRVTTLGERGSWAAYVHAEERVLARGEATDEHGAIAAALHEAGRMADDVRAAIAAWRGGGL